MKFTAAIIALTLTPLAAMADTALSFQDGYARSTNPKSGAIFGVFHNAGDQACTVTRATTDHAERAEFHTHQDVDGVMRMVEIEGGIEVPAGGSHTLERGADHIMLMGLTQPLVNGSEVSVSLDFGTCGVLDIVVPVDNDRAGHADHADHADHGEHGA